MQKCARFVSGRTPLGPSLELEIPATTPSVLWHGPSAPSRTSPDRRFAVHLFNDVSHGERFTVEHCRRTSGRTGHELVLLLEGKISFPFQARCVTTRPSPRSEG